MITTIIHNPIGSIVSLVKRFICSQLTGNKSGGADDIMNHAWFKDADFDWDGLLNKDLKAPYAPNCSDPLDVSNFDEYDEEDYIPPYTGNQSVFDAF